jgi:Zn-dependent protease with chaperone function
VKLDTANRNFFLLLGVALAPYLLLGLFGCGVLSVAAFRLASDGSSGWGPATWPALGFLAVTAAGSLLGSRSLWRQRRATIALARYIQTHRLPTDAAVATAAQAEQVRRIELVDSEEAFSFTYGIRRPRVVVSRGLFAVVDEAELRAVLAHERYHVRNLDPLKVVVARAVPSAFFFLPALGHLRARYLAGRELAADRRAVRACGRRSLAGALYKASGGSSLPTLSAAAAMGSSELLETRLAQLEAGQEPPLPRISRLALVSTAAGVGLMAVGLAATVLLVDAPLLSPGGPLTARGSGACGGLWLVAALGLYRSLEGQRPT